MNLYISWFDWSRAVTGLEWQSLVGNTGRIGNTLLGATTINVIPNLIVALNQYDVITIYDGSNSENVIVTSNASIGASSVNISATTFAHSAGTPYSTDGIQGSLADQIIKASQWLETIVKNQLFVSTYTNENLAIPTMRASIDNQYALHFRPRHWPVQNISSIAITTIVGNTITYDPTQIIIDSDKQICSLPNMLPLVVGVPLSGQYYPVWNVPNRSREAQLTITYSAGFSVMPPDVIEAATLLTSDILALRQNPIGALDLSSGERRITSAIRGDTTGDTLLFKRAKKILDNYSMQTF